jgi:hypothetical protein
MNIVEITLSGLPLIIFFIISERDEEVVEDRGGSCEVGLGMCGTPSRIGGVVYSVGTPVKYQAW